MPRSRVDVAFGECSRRRYDIAALCVTFMYLPHNRCDEIRFKKKNWIFILVQYYLVLSFNFFPFTKIVILVSQSDKILFWPSYSFPTTNIGDSSPSRTSRIGYILRLTRRNGFTLDLLLFFRIKRTRFLAIPWNNRKRQKIYIKKNKLISFGFGGAIRFVESARIVRGRLCRNSVNVNPLWPRVVEQ